MFANSDSVDQDLWEFVKVRKSANDDVYIVQAHGSHVIKKSADGDKDEDDVTALVTISFPDVDTGASHSMYYPHQNKRVWIVNGNSSVRPKGDWCRRFIARHGHVNMAVLNFVQTGAKLVDGKRILTVPFVEDSEEESESEASDSPDESEDYDDDEEEQETEPLTQVSLYRCDCC